MTSNKILEYLHIRYPSVPIHDDIGEYVYRVGTPVDTLMYRWLFWPTFIEVHGMVFLENDIDSSADSAQRVSETLASYGGDRTKTEIMYNVFELPWAFDGSQVTGEVDDDLWLDLGRSLCDMWRAKLNLTFPTGEFVVRLIGEDPDDSFIGILVYERRDDPHETNDDQDQTG